MQMNWIPVTERLPDKAGGYIVATDNGGVLTAHFYPEKGFNSSVLRKHITHWMEKPKHPAKENG